MAIEVLVVCRGTIWRGKRREEFRNEIDEHCAVAGPNLGTAPLRDKRGVTAADLTTRVLGLRRRRAQPAADFGEKFPVGACETFHTARDDLVEHAIDLGVCPGVGLASSPRLRPRRGRRDAAAPTDPG